MKSLFQFCKNVLSYPLRTDRFNWRDSMRNFAKARKYERRSGIRAGYVGHQNDPATRSFSLLIAADAFPEYANRMTGM